MPSQQLTAFFLRAAPLTFAFLWSSGFIVAKYAAPDAEPFTFLIVRFGIDDSDPGLDRGRKRRAVAGDCA